MEERLTSHAGNYVKDWLKQSVAVIMYVKFLSKGFIHR